MNNNNLIFINLVNGIILYVRGQERLIVDKLAAIVIKGKRGAGKVCLEAPGASRSELASYANGRAAVDSRGV